MGYLDESGNLIPAPTRRGFFGSIIGSLIVSRLPFIAEEEIIYPLKGYKLERIFDESIEFLEHCKLFYIVNGKKIKSAKLKSVNRTIDRIEFKAEGWEANQYLIANKMGVLLPDNKLLVEGKFAGGNVEIDSGDTLIGTYTIANNFR